MNHIDPCYPKIPTTAQYDRELSIEEVAEIDRQMQAVDRLPQAIQEGMNSPVHREAEAADAMSSPDPYNTESDQPSIERRDDLKIPTIARKVSGCYSNCPRPWKLELRVDVDSYRPTKMISGDFYYVSGSTTSYFGSFKVEAPTINVTSTQVTLIGIADTTWSTPYRKVRVVIPRHNIFQPAANAYLQWYTLTDKKGADYVCLFDSPHFRTVQIEEDYETGVVPFSSYNTGSLPSGGTPRTLNVAKAYAEAGIELQSTFNNNAIPTSEADSDHEWSNAELHDAMEKHFSLWQNVPGWKVWLFHAHAHEYGTGLRGIMFDQKDRQRQGCASFYQAISSGTAADMREQLYVNVHELGHCFNLFHSFHKKYMNPPMPNRPAALSWMNYPWYYPGGPAAFWNAFPFQFDELELKHLRHAYRNHIVIGGNPFGEGAAVEEHSGFMDNVRDESGLQLRLTSPHFVALGTPIHVDIQLTNYNREPLQVATDLHPNCGLVDIMLQKPNGKVVNYHPPISYLVAPDVQSLGSNETIEETAYIGFDNEDGQLFDEPGTYRLFATYYALDGSAIRSEVNRINVSAPRTLEDEYIAELMLGREQGMLFFLEGSYSDSLQKGNDAFAEILTRFKDHPLANHVRYVEGLKKRRGFLQVDTERKLTLKKQDKGAADELLNSVLSADPIEAGFIPQVFDQMKSQIKKPAGKTRRKPTQSA